MCTVQHGAELTVVAHSQEPLLIGRHVDYGRGEGRRDALEEIHECVEREDHGQNAHCGQQHRETIPLLRAEQVSRVAWCGSVSDNQE